MREIRERSGGNVNFVGAGGRKMAAEGIEDSFYDNSEFDAKSFHPFRSTDATRWNWWLWAPFNPITYKHNKAMWSTLKTIKNNDILTKIMCARPSSIVTIGHEQLSLRIHQQLAELYGQSSLDRPSQIHFGKFIKNILLQEQGHLDHVLYSVPIDPVNFNFSRKFPSTYVGQVAFEKALRYLLEKWDTDKQFLRDDSVMMHRTHFYEEIEPFILKEREEFRKEHDIPEDNTVFFLEPGHLEKDVKWALPIMQKTINKLMTQLEARGINTNEFSVVVPVTKSSAKHIKGVDIGKWGCRLISTDNA